MSCRKDSWVRTQLRLDDWEALAPETDNRPQDALG